jgi:hypothetical protein
MFVLDPAGVTKYDREDGKWAKTGFWAGDFPAVRDLRGALEMSGAMLVVTVAGQVCHIQTENRLECEPGGFLELGRNTFRTGDWPERYSQWDNGRIHVQAETDGKTRIYDSNHQLLKEVEGWGSDFVALPESCGAAMLLATSPSDAYSADSVAAYRIVNNSPAPSSDPLAFPGPVTALAGSLAVTHNLSTGRYEAYSLTFDCSAR